MSRIVALLLTVCVAGCGQRGPLVLPPGPPPAPLLDRLVAPSPPATPIQPAGNEADGSTDKKPPAQ
ncbi:MAG: lipoprotein [Dechloromonas sp.]|uniref:Lipoprotein n=1 Tax=Candidatus Dechloromonas phosphorivorans TaxID=2899244 RepID=A0A9D7LLA0_9RHOO|nr:lipoprotein [Candidatus Dechloromonas phosphorivorans]